MNYFIFCFIGFILGYSVSIFIRLFHYSYGNIDVDPITNQCRVHLNPIDLGNKKIKRVILKVNHDITLTREEQVL